MVTETEKVYDLLDISFLHFTFSLSIFIFLHSIQETQLDELIFLLRVFLF